MSPLNKEYRKASESFIALEDLNHEASSRDPSRRDFLKLMGFSFAVSALSACSTPPRKVIPYLVKPEEITPGVANGYASTCAGCSAGCGVLVKSQDGRPIKIEGNREHPLSEGGVCASGQATVLSLYDAGRLKGPSMKNGKADWRQMDEAILRQLKNNKDKKNIVILSSTLLSPSTRQLIADFSKVYPATRHVTYDPVSVYAIRKAHELTFGKAILPAYRFEKADLIVNFGADFLSTWIDPVGHTKAYARLRKIKNGQMSRHIQFESLMTLTGSNADLRIPMATDEEGLTLLWLLKFIARKDNHLKELNHLPQPRISLQRIEAAASELWQKRGKSLVLSGTNDVHIQVIVNLLNELLGSYGATIDLDNPSYQKQGDDEAVETLVNDMNAGGVSILIVYGVNPLYSYYDQERFLSGLKKVPVKISFSDRQDETAGEMDYLCPDHHYLESWNDAHPAEPVYSLTQPVISPLYQTRAAQESLLKWMGKDVSYYEYIQNYWQKELYPKQKRYLSFQQFWDKSLHDGVFETPLKPIQKRAFRLASIAAALKAHSQATAGILTADLYQKAALREGQHANNPWLQELPDPVSKVTWANYATISPQMARQYEIQQGDQLRVQSERGTVILPAVVLPGQSEKTIGMAVGYGRTHAGPAGNQVGQNIYSWVSFRNGSFQYRQSPVVLEKTGLHAKLACTQVHQQMEGRPIIQETTFEEYQKNPRSGNEDHHDDHSLWREHRKLGSFWGMVIDLNACTGCSGCVIACQAENNIPTVGQLEVSRNREMHWLRIDRYYSGSDEEPEVLHQPMLCQHCEHAPCETVCPTLATVHSSDGLNMQTYNRCVGTRYCANNCPYKVRRFNWFKYAHDDLLANMVLNPDVVVRSRGIMEK